MTEDPEIEITLNWNRSGFDITASGAGPKLDLYTRLEQLRQAGYSGTVTLTDDRGTRTIDLSPESDFDNDD